MQAPVGYLTRLSVIRLATTGESFVDAGKALVDVVKHNLMDAFAVSGLSLC
jgi:hypothetical protein